MCERGVSRRGFHALHSTLTFTTDPTGRNVRGVYENQTLPQLLPFLSAVETSGVEMWGYTPLTDVLTRIFEPTGHALPAKMDVTVNSCWT